MTISCSCCLSVNDGPGKWDSDNSSRADSARQPRLQAGVGLPCLVGSHCGNLERLEFRVVTCITRTETVTARLWPSLHLEKWPPDMSQLIQWYPWITWPVTVTFPGISRWLKSWFGICKYKILVMGYPWISLKGITWYNSVWVGISRDTSALISGIARDIPVSAFFERVIPWYPYVCMSKSAYSGLLNAQLVLTMIWISSWKLHFSSAAQQLRRS